MSQLVPQRPGAQTDTRGAWVGSGPTNASDFYSFFLPLVFFFFFISSDVNFFVVVVVILFFLFCFVFKQITSGLVFLQTQAPGEGTRQTQTCDRQAVCPRAVGLQTPTLSGETRAQLFTAAGPQARPSSGSAHSATCRRGGATHGSPQTGWCGAGPARQCTA